MGTYGLSVPGQIHSANNGINYRNCINHYYFFLLRCDVRFNMIVFYISVVKLLYSGQIGLDEVRSVMLPLLLLHLFVWNFLYFFHFQYSRVNIIIENKFFENIIQNVSILSMVNKNGEKMVNKKCPELLQKHLPII